MPRYQITISGRDRQAMADLVLKHSIDVSDHGVRKDEKGVYHVPAFANQQEIERLNRAGYQIERGEDVDELAKKRMAEVGRGDRYRN